MKALLTIGTIALIALTGTTVLVLYKTGESMASRSCGRGHHEATH